MALHCRAIATTPSIGWVVIGLSDRAAPVGGIIPSYSFTADRDRALWPGPRGRLEKADTLRTGSEPT